MPSISDFLEARITEDEAYATQAAGPHYGWNDLWAIRADKGSETESVIMAHAFRNSPVRSLAECAAKRETVNRLSSIATNDEPYYRAFKAWAVEGLKVQAAVYSDHPDYQQEWSL